MVVLSKYRTTPSAAGAATSGGGVGLCRVSCRTRLHSVRFRVNADRSIQTPASRLPLSATQRPAKLIQQTEENMLPRIPRQQPIHDLPPRPRGSAPEPSSSPAETCRSPSATTSAFPPDASPANGPSPATPAPPRPSGSRPTTPSPCTPNSRASHRPARSASERRP